MSSSENECELNITIKKPRHLQNRFLDIKNVKNKLNNLTPSITSPHRTRSNIAASNPSAPDIPTPPLTGWKKLLWLKQPYADNYTDKSFLSQLKRNSTVIKYSYTRLVSDFSIIVLHLSLNMSAIVVFYGIYRLNWNPLKPTILSTILTILGFIFYVVTLKIRRNRELIELQQFKIRQLYMLSSNNNDISAVNVNNCNNLNFDEFNMEDYLTEPSVPNFFETCKSSILIILYLLTLSPVLKSLTNSTSSDSIWALSAWLCFLNVMFNDYQIDFPKVSDEDKKSHWQKILLHNFTISQTPPASPSSTRSSSPIRSSIPNLNTIPNDQLNLNIKDFHVQPASSLNISKNIAVSNAIVLASRLKSNAAAFSFILFCIQTCGLFPIFNNFTRRCDFQGFHKFQFLTIILTVDWLVWYLFGTGWLITWISLHFMIIVVGPLYFLKLQKYKNELQGPWDPAKPIVKSI